MHLLCAQSQLDDYSRFRKRFTLIDTLKLKNLNRFFFILITILVFLRNNYVTWTSQLLKENYQLPTRHAH